MSVCGGVISLPAKTLAGWCLCRETMYLAVVHSDWYAVPIFPKVVGVQLAKHVSIGDLESGHVRLFKLTGVPTVVQHGLQTAGYLLGDGMYLLITYRTVL